MSEIIKSIIIVGGGTAGWLTAGIIAARHQSRINNSDLTITLVESANIPSVGVGEGTWPTMPNTLRIMGISETEFFRQCQVSFKQGSKFVNWDNESQDNFYYHPFDVPEGALTGDSANYWLSENEQNSLAKTLTSQEAICESGLAPKTISSPEYAGYTNYGYHLDAVKFAEFLQKHCVNQLGVRHILADVHQVKLTNSQSIESIILADARNLQADFFIDCSGFKSLLIGEALGVKFNEVGDILFADTALAVQVPYNDDTTIASYTKSTAQSAGWIWDIGLPSRRGVGYVYASQYISRDEAQAELVQYLKASGDYTETLSIREIKFKSGYREKFFHKNCVAIGLSAGFLEPLEASALVMVELSATMIAEQLPTTKSTLPIVAKRFNEAFDYRWQRTIEFLKLHYLVSNRTTPFWLDNKKAESVPSRLQEQMTLWQFNPPTQLDFNRLGEVFQAPSYQFVLYGSQFRTQSLFPLDPIIKNRVINSIDQTNLRTAQLLTTLPTNRDLIDQIYSYGMKNI